MTLLSGLKIVNPRFDGKPQLDCNISGLKPVFYGRIFCLNPVARGVGSKRLGGDLSGPKKGIAIVK